MEVWACVSARRVWSGVEEDGLLWRGTVSVHVTVNVTVIVSVTVSVTVNVNVSASASARCEKVGRREGEGWESG